MVDEVGLEPTSGSQGGLIYSQLPSPLGNSSMTGLSQYLSIGSDTEN